MTRVAACASGWRGLHSRPSTGAPRLARGRSSANAGRLADQFPAEHARSQELILALLVDALDAGTRAGEIRVLDVRRDAQCVYDLTFGFMQRHVLARTTPTRGDVDHLVTATELILGLH